MRREVIVQPDLEALSEAAAGEIAACARDSIAIRGRFVIALSGGSTPRRTYELLAERDRDTVAWSRIHVVFGDERHVPHDDGRSNYRMARESLLDRVPVAPERVHPVPVGEGSAEQAAERYERTLRDLLGGGVSRSETGGTTVDVALLGMGRDGHTASLFPGSPALDERQRWVRAVSAPAGVQPDVARITTTFPFLERARVVLVLVAGADKRDVVHAVLAGGESGRSYPAARVQATDRLVWMLDAAAAARIA